MSVVWDVSEPVRFLGGSAPSGCEMWVPFPLSCSLGSEGELPTQLLQTRPPESAPSLPSGEGTGLVLVSGHGGGRTVRSRLPLPPKASHPRVTQNPRAISSLPASAPHFWMKREKAVALCDLAFQKKSCRRQLNGPSGAPSGHPAPPQPGPPFLRPLVLGCDPLVRTVQVWGTI